MENIRLNILVSAFRCEPGKGGEPGVGWNFSINMASHHNVWVLTRMAHKRLIDDELAMRPVKNLQFVYYDLPDTALTNEKLLGEQAYYLLWQLFVMLAYKKVSKTIDFDLVHHITYNQYRSPSLGFFVKQPFIIGPIGGAETIAPPFFRDLSFKGRLKEYWRNMGFDIYFFVLLCKVKANPKRIIFSSERNSNKIKKYLPGLDSQVIPSIAIDKSDFLKYNRVDNSAPEKPFTIIYSGTAKDWKGLLILIKSIATAYNRGEHILVKLIGIRNEAERIKVSQWVDEFGLTSKVLLIDFMPREELIKELSNADISAYPAFRDSGSMAVLEACALGCPVICFDAGGQDAFPKGVLIKIPVSDTYEANLINFSEKLRWCYNNRDTLFNIGMNAREYVFNNFTWKQKVAFFSKLYLETLLPVQNVLEKSFKIDTTG